VLKKRPLLPKPDVILFDWHGTLVNTADAMFNAMEELLPQLEVLKLSERIVSEKLCKTQEDVKLVRYIRIFRRLHPRILAERRISRTDIFNVIFGDDNEAKDLAHHAYNACYRKYYGKVQPIQPGVKDYLHALQALGITLGIATNRSREFLQHELAEVDQGIWQPCFSTLCCADDVTAYKPNPAMINTALKLINKSCSTQTWYIGDSYQDIVTAKRAGVTAILYNGACWDAGYIRQIFQQAPDLSPDAIIDSYDDLLDLLQYIQDQNATAFKVSLADIRPPEYPPPPPPYHRIEPDWHPSVAVLTPPQIILFDWHATLVDTMDAMYHAVDDMLPELNEQGLLHRLVPPEKSKTIEDARLIQYVRNNAQLHPKIKADRKISRTDIFEVLFGDDQEAKKIAHEIFTKHYRKHYGTVLPFEPQVRNMLIGLRALPLKIGIITNRDREFFEHELSCVEEGSWKDLFDMAICGDDVQHRKPHPDQLLKASESLHMESTPAIWYVGDSTTDTIAAKRANQTAVFFNGAQWDLPWLKKIFPGTEKFPYEPDVVVNDFSEFWALVLACLSK